MNTMIKRAGCLLAALALVGMANAVQAQGEVTVGGVVDFVGGTTDHDKGADGFDRGYFSAIKVNYANTLDNGLKVSGRINYLVNQRYEFAPDELFVGVAGGFGTVTLGSHAMASCATLPRPLNFAGVDSTWYTKFSGVGIENVTFAETNYCGTPTAISYSTPKIGGFKAMATYAPHSAATQAKDILDGVVLKDDGSNMKSVDGNKPDLMAVAASFSSSMGGMDVNLGASYQTSDANKKGEEVDSIAAAGTIGMGGATVGASWYDNGDRNSTGFNVAAKYALGAITPGITWSQQEWDSGAMKGREQTALALRVAYAVGGGLTVFADYIGFDVDYMMDGESMSDDETLLMGGAQISF